MKNIVYFVLIMLFSWINVKGQNNYEEIIKTFNSYRLLIEQKEYDKAFDYYLDSFLKYIPKEQLKKQFSELNNNENVEYSVSDSKIKFISETVQDSAKKEYAFIKYTSYYHYKFKESAGSEYREKIKTMYQKKHGPNYSYDEDEKKISFLLEGELIAIKVGLKWNFIIYNGKLNPFMNIWVPQDTFNALLINRNGKNMMN